MLCSCSKESTGSSIHIPEVLYCLLVACYFATRAGQQHSGVSCSSLRSVLQSVGAAAGEPRHFVLLTNFPSQGRLFMYRHCETNMLLFFPGESLDCRATPHWLFHKRRLLGSVASLQQGHLYPFVAFVVISSQNRHWHSNLFVPLYNKLQLCLATFSGSVFLIFGKFPLSTNGEYFHCSLH